MYLQKAQIEAFSDLRQQVDQAIEQLLRCCRTLESVTVIREFPYIYAAVLLANRGRISDAAILLQECSANRFATTLGSFLEKHQAFKAPAVVFTDSRPYDIYTRTGFYLRHMAAATEAVASFARQYPPPGDDGRFTILDVGTGNGVFITEIINHIARDRKSASVRLFVLDHSEAMHAAAEAYLSTHADLDISVSHIHSRIQDLAPGSLAGLLAADPVWFVNAGLSIHHMPDETKVNVLREFARVSEHCLITDCNSNHDLPEKDSPEFVYSVAFCYDQYIGGVLDSALTDEEKQLCISDFWLAEAINMLSHERASRIDYHATIEQWSEYAKRGGYQTVKVTPIVLYQDLPLTFTMHLRRLAASRGIAGC